MDWKDEAKKRWEMYQSIIEDAPLVHGSMGIADSDTGHNLGYREVMIGCVTCGGKYRAVVNGYNEGGNSALRDAIITLDLVCPHCRAHASNIDVFYFHSGGIFNAALGGA